MLLHSVNVKKPLVFFCKMDFKKGDPSKQLRTRKRRVSILPPSKPPITDNNFNIESTCKVASAHPKWAAHKHIQALNQKNNPKHKMRKGGKSQLSPKQKSQLKKTQPKNRQNQNRKKPQTKQQRNSAKNPKVSAF